MRFRLSAVCLLCAAARRSSSTEKKRKHDVVRAANKGIASRTELCNARTDSPLGTTDSGKCQRRLIIIFLSSEFRNGVHADVMEIKIVPSTSFLLSSRYVIDSRAARSLPACRKQARECPKRAFIKIHCGGRIVEILFMIATLNNPPFRSM